MPARALIESFWLSERLALRGSYTQGAFQRLVAARYVLAPKSEPEAIALYRVLGEKISQQGKQLSSRFTATPTLDDPYPSMKALSRDINTQKAAGTKKPNVKVYAAPPQGGHPGIPDDTNTLLRWVHDLIAHYAGQHPFSGRGEFGAYNRHLKTLPPKVAPILFTEIVGQTSVYKIYGDYTDQKAVILKDFDPFNVGALLPSSPLNRWFVLEDKLLRPRPDFSWSNFQSSQAALARELTRQPNFNPTAWEGYSADQDPSTRHR